MYRIRARWGSNPVSYDEDFTGAVNGCQAHSHIFAAQFAFITDDNNQCWTLDRNGHPIDIGIHKWDRRGLELAQFVSGWSKDPSTQCGAAVLRPDCTVASVGYNGFPKGIKDDGRLTDTELKRSIIRHAEENAISNAYSHYDLEGGTMFVYPLHPCTKCAGAIIQAGIRRVVAVAADHPDWPPDQPAAFLREAGVEVEIRKEIPNEQ